MRATEQAIRQADWLRRSPRAAGGRHGHKEWLHFCIYGPEIDVLVNFSVLDDVRPTLRAHRELARVTLLVHDGGWAGEVTRYPAEEVEIEGGFINARFGPNSVQFADGRYTLAARFRERAIAVDVTLEPVTMPSIVHNVRVGDGPPINWLVVPRLLANGRIIVGDRIHVIDGALAYHDHNWGHFGWGRDFAWEWGYGLPENPANPWSLVFVRLSDRAHTRCMMQGVFLWRGSCEQRLFRDHDLRVRHLGLLRSARICKVPAVMALVHPDQVTGIPRELHVEGGADGDAIEAVFRGADVAQVIVPNDRDFGVTVINEVSGRFGARGVVRGERLAIDGRAVFEFLGA
jgi:hypothetical protein